MCYCRCPAVNTQFHFHPAYFILYFTPVHTVCMPLFGLFRGRDRNRNEQGMPDGYLLNADHILVVLYYHGKTFSMPCDVGRLPIKGKLCWGWSGVGRRDKTKARMEQEMWVYMVVVVGGWVKINKSDSLYLSA